MGYIREKHREKAVPFLLAALKDKDFHMRQAACMSLGRTGLGKEKNTKPFLDTFQDQAHRGTAAWACAEIGPGALFMLPWLVKGLEDPDEGIRWKCAYAISTMRRGARSAAKALEKAKGDSSLIVRLAAAAALGKLAK
jgi:HEAT repeat protein